MRSLHIGVSLVIAFIALSSEVQGLYRVDSEQGRVHTILVPKKTTSVKIKEKNNLLLGENLVEVGSLKSSRKSNSLCILFDTNFIIVLSWEFYAKWLCQFGQESKL